MVDTTTFRISQIAGRIRDLYDRAGGPRITDEEIQKELKPLAKLPRKHLDSVARSLDIRRPFKSKAAVRAAIWRLIVDRKGMRERSTV